MACRLDSLLLNLDLQSLVFLRQPLVPRIMEHCLSHSTNRPIEVSESFIRQSAPKERFRAVRLSDIQPLLFFRRCSARDYLYDSLSRVVCRSPVFTDFHESGCQA